MVHAGGEAGGGAGGGADERFVEGRERVGPATAVHLEAGLEATVDAQERGRRVEAGETGRQRERKRGACCDEIVSCIVEQRGGFRICLVARDERALHGGILGHIEHETERVTHAQLIQVLECHECLHESLYAALLRGGVVGYRVDDVENRVGRAEISV